MVSGSTLRSGRASRYCKRLRVTSSRALTGVKLGWRDILTRDAIYNAFVVDMALGGSTNSVLHLTAIAHEAGVNYPLSWLNEISQNTPHLCKMSPSGYHHLEDLNAAGGIYAVMHQVSTLLRLDARTVSGQTLGELVPRFVVKDTDVIRSTAEAYSPTGGLTILFGNIAPEGAVVKSAAVAPEMRVHQGPARVFDSEEDATKAITAKSIKPGDVVVIRYEGPKGGPRDAHSDVAACRAGIGQAGGTHH